MSRPLEGIRILEWGLYAAVPTAAMFMARLGAEVIKIENPQGGDTSRGTKYMWGNDMTGPGGMSLWFESLNLNKKSVSLNLKSKAGLEVFYQLVEKSDVLLTNFRQSARQRLGITYETLKQRNPRLVYVCISGYGSRGEEADRPGIDFCLQARSGLLRAMKGPEDEPSYVAGLADQVGAACALSGVFYGLFTRERSGRGVNVDGSLLGGMTWLQANYMAPLFLGAQARKPVHRKSALNPLHNLYPTANGGWLALSLGTQTQRYWPTFCDALDLQHLKEDARFATSEKREENNIELIELLSRVFAEHTSQEIAGRLSKADLMAEVVQTPAEFAEDPQALANACMEAFEHPVLGPVKALGVPIAVDGMELQTPHPAPQLGQDTAQVLTDVLGYSDEKLGALLQSGAAY